MKQRKVESMFVFDEKGKRFAITFKAKDIKAACKEIGKNLKRK